jgi:hypothetical protein
MTDVRIGQAPAPLDRAAFGRRFRARFVDPAFRREDDALARLEQIAWEAYHEGRKAPHTHKAGPGYANPDYDLSDDWRDAKEKLDAAQKRWADAATPSRVLVICGASRNDGTCPGEISKTWRITNWLQQTLSAQQISTPARPVCRPRCRCATGRAAATPTTPTARPTTG